jgi:PPM family protein phosphatase
LLLSLSSEFTPGELHMDSDSTDKIQVDLNAAQEQPSEPAEPIVQEVGWGIDKGKERSNNEDSLAAVTVNQASETEKQSVGIYAVADGMGGHQAGEIASKLAVRTALRKLVGEVTESDGEMPENYQNWLKSAVALANQMVHNKGRESRKTMGTTLVMAVVVGHDVRIVNVGDSRAYLIGPDGIRQITKDHSLVQMLVDAGAITQEQAAEHPQRNILTQSIGTQPEVTVDAFQENLDDDESLLLCSDGLWEMLNDDQIWKIVQAAKTPDEACQALVEAANSAGGHDNIAAVLVRLGASIGSAESSTESPNA